MAAIDKIYGNNSEYDEFRKWAEENKPGILRYFYERTDNIVTQRAISNFPVRVDMWLLRHCPIRWVVERIMEQYDLTPENFSLRVAEIERDEAREALRVIANHDPAVWCDGNNLPEDACDTMQKMAREALLWASPSGALAQMREREAGR